MSLQASSHNPLETSPRKENPEHWEVQTQQLCPGRPGAGCCGRFGLRPGEGGIRNLNVSPSCSLTCSGNVGFALCWDQSHRPPPGVAEAWGPDLWIEEGPLGTVLSEMDRTSRAVHLLLRLLPFGSVSLGLDGHALRAWTVFLRPQASRTVVFHSCSAFSLCDCWQA